MLVPVPVPACHAWHWRAGALGGEEGRKIVLNLPLENRGFPECEIAKRPAVLNNFVADSYAFVFCSQN